MKLKALLLSGFMMIGLIGQSQAFWILVFGDKLSNDRMQSGINAFITTSNIYGVSGTKPMTSWALGGFMDIRLKEKWNISVEFTVKSPSGASEFTDDISSYLPNDTLSGGNIRLENTNFSLPIYLKYKTKYMNFAIGPEMILAYKSSLIYTAENNNKDKIKLTRNSMDIINKFDIGISSSIEFYLFPKKPKSSIRLGLRYYYGFLSPLKDNASARNSVLMFKVGIPIVGKSAINTEE